MSINAVRLVSLSIASLIPTIAYAAPPKVEAGGVRRIKRPKATAEEMSMQSIRGDKHLPPDSLLSIPELQLFGNEEMQDILDDKYLQKYKFPSYQRDGFLYEHNKRLHRVALARAKEAGLPLRGKDAILPPIDALVMQALSKEIRKAGFLSIGIAEESPADRADSFAQWCKGNRIERFSGAAATLVQMLQIEDEPFRVAMVQQLGKVRTSKTSCLLAERAIYDLSPLVRQKAVAELSKRPAKDYLLTLTKGLRYPWLPVAERSADALGKLKPPEAVATLVAMLDADNPKAPFEDAKSKKMMVREVVRINHMRNCLLCHVPSAGEKDGLVRGSIPPPPLLPTSLRFEKETEADGFDVKRRLEQPIRDMPYYQKLRSECVRADVTLLRQDFSAILKIKDLPPWPDRQRFDFVTRTRPATPKEILRAVQGNRDYPQRKAILRALRSITGKDGGDSRSQWQELIGVTTKGKK